MTKWDRESRELRLQEQYGRRLSMQDISSDDGLVPFFRDVCDWVLLAGNRVTMKIATDRYSKTGGYITQKKISGEDRGLETEYHANFEEALTYAQEQISTGV